MSQRKVEVKRFTSALRDGSSAMFRTQRISLSGRMRTVYIAL